jgi:adenine-specific DNA-methyltransferase
MNNEQNLLKEIDDLKIEIKKLKAHKKYGLVWGEKPEKFEKDSIDALPILLEKGGKFKDIVNNKKDDFNILIEGDNYHSLSILNYTHKGKIDVIYIDPPYNTGNRDFIYNDYFVDKEDRYRHSKWLSFMEKRLKLAKTLLSKSGVIFISVDDHEQAQLKLLCDSIFGEENFVEQFIWQKSFSPKNDAKYFSTSHEYILCISKVKSNFQRVLLTRTDKQNNSYKNPDDDTRGVWTSTSMLATTFSQNYVFEFTSPNGKKHLPPKGRCWRYSKDKISELIKDNRIYFGATGNNVPRTKRFLSEVLQGVVPQSILNFDLVGSGQDGTNNLRNIFNNTQIFDFPKPTSLIKFILNISSKQNSTILDFFAGSGTTGQAVVELNEEDNGNRKFILCTNNGDEENEHKICEDICFKRLDIVMSKGYKDKKPLGGNLKYLKTDFIKYKDTNIDTLKRKIVEASTEILCLKENTFDLVKDIYKNEKIKIYQNNKKYTAILFDLFYLDEFIERLRELKDKHISIYVFSYTKEFDRDEIGELNTSYSIEPIPENILETYKKIFNF